MDDEAPQAAGIADLVDWGELVRLLEPVTLDMVRETYPDWRVGREGDWSWAVRTVPEDTPGPHSLLRTVVIARTPIGLAEQLDTQECMRALPLEEFVPLLSRVQGAAGQLAAGPCAAAQGAAVALTGDAGVALTQLRELYGDRHTFGFDPVRGVFWVLRDGMLSSLMTAPTQAALGGLLDNAAEVLP